jgi:hypothetical protein
MRSVSSPRGARSLRAAPRRGVKPLPACRGSWADYGQSNTIILVGLPRGRHKVLIEVVDPEGNVFTKQTVTFRTPGKPARQ